MWLGKRGLVVKIGDGCCIILTGKGTYERIPVPPQGARVGAEVSYSYQAVISPVFRPMMLVASFLILFVCYSLLSRSGLPVAVAYVSLDINPSLELSVDKNMDVIDVKCFNTDAFNLLKQERLQGKNLYDALRIVVAQAIAENYIKPGQDNLIVSTVTQDVSPSSASPSNAGAPPVDQQSIQQFLEKSINQGGLSGEVKTYSATGEFRSEAENQGLSPGKYLIYEQLKQAGNQVSIDDVRKNSIHNLVDTYKLSLLPNYENIRIQRRKNGEEPDITVNDNGRYVSMADFLKEHGRGAAALPKKTNNSGGQSAQPWRKSRRTSESTLPWPGVQGAQTNDNAPVKHESGEEVGNPGKPKNLRETGAVKTRKKKKRKAVGEPTSISTDGISWGPGNLQP